MDLAREIGRRDVDRCERIARGRVQLVNRDGLRRVRRRVRICDGIDDLGDGIVRGCGLRAEREEGAAVHALHLLGPERPAPNALTGRRVHAERDPVATADEEHALMRADRRCQNGLRLRPGLSQTELPGEVKVRDACVREHFRIRVIAVVRHVVAIHRPRIERCRRDSRGGLHGNATGRYRIVRLRNRSATPRAPAAGAEHGKRAGAKECKKDGSTVAATTLPHR